jgi:nitrite reductase (NADH) small subunit
MCPPADVDADALPDEREWSDAGTREDADAEPEREFIRVSSTRDFTKTDAIVREVHGHEIAIFRIGEAYHAVTNVCPHQHSPVLAEGMLDGCIVTCPMHGWSFDVVTGRSVNASGRLKQYTLRVEGDAISILDPGPPLDLAW